MAFENIIKEYTENLTMGEQVYREKKRQIKEARDAFRQITPDGSIGVADDTLMFHGNNDTSDNTSPEYSSYFIPIMRAVADKLIQDLTTNPFRFEYDGNNKIGYEVRNALSSELRNIFTYENNKRSMVHGFWHLVVSGTKITQTITAKRKKSVINVNGEVKELQNGRGISLVVYDPLTVIPDWNALPHNIKETMNWCIVTVGEFSQEEIERRWPDVDVKGSFTSSQQMDQDKYNLEQDAGVDRNQANGKIVIREYYKRDGYRYTILNDSIVVEKTPNSNGTYGYIPINFAPMFIDPDCVFGDSLYQVLKPSIEVASASINQVLDRNSLNNSMPLFFDQDAFPAFREGMTLQDFDKNMLVPMDASNFVGTNGKTDINSFFARPQVPDVTQGAVWTYEKALEMIWIVTGLNPTTLGGVQEKQIRNANVAGMIQQSSLRNSSQIVANLETNFMNPTSWDILQIFDLYYDDFKSFKEAGIPNGFLSDLFMVRVVNGSYLPGDNQNRLNKMANLLQLAVKNPQSFNFVRIYDQLLDSMGIANPDIYMKSPEEMLSAQEAAQMLEIYSTEGPEALLMFLQQQLQMAQAGGVK